MTGTLEHDSSGPAAMSVRCCAPGKSMSATPSYAAARAAATSAPVPTTASTRPPAVTRSPSTMAVPAWITCTPATASAAAIPVITSPDDDEAG